MEKTAYILLGVVLTVFLNALKELWFQKGKNKKDLEYLTIRISSLLDIFVSSCADVVADDGLCFGQADERGCRSIQVKTPNFDPLEIDVEWKSLPRSLMYEILSFPNLILEANHRIAGEFEYSSSPPDYEEGFEERQFQYAKLALKADELSERLRRAGKLPINTELNTDEWNVIKWMSEKIEEVEKSRHERAENQRRMLEELRGNS